MLPLSVPRYRTSREEWGRTAVICVALGEDLGMQRDSRQRHAKRLSLLNLKELTAQQYLHIICFTGRNFKTGMIFRRRKTLALRQIMSKDF